MQLTDQELFYILQVKAPAKPMPWENVGSAPLGHEWAEWAKVEVLSGKGVGSARGVDLEHCGIYLARLLRVLETVAENGGLETRRREDGAFVFEQSTLTTILSDGLEACGCPAFNHEDALFLATHNGLISEHGYDDWHPGMASGSGWRTYYGLTFKGKRQAEKVSLMSPASDEASDEMRQDGDGEKVQAEGPEAVRGQQPESVGESASEMSAEEQKTADLGLLLLLAQTYYHLLESAVSMATRCTAVDLDLNGYYLWTVKNIRNLLENQESLKDFPMPFEPPFADLLPTSIGDVDWQDMIAPDAECFLSTVQEYTLEEGVQAPKEGSQAWNCVEMFRPSINLAIASGNAYRNRMEEYCRKNLKVQPAARAGATKGAKTEASAADRPEAAQANEKSKTPAIMSVAEVWRLCRAKPNEAFFYWKSLAKGMPTADTVQTENKGAIPEVLQFLDNWFERCGHWRDLTLDESTGSNGGGTRPDGLQGISDFVRSRRAQVQYVDYDEVHADHVRKESEREYTEYTWTYLLAGEPQVILRVDDPDARMREGEEHYLSKATPSGYSYSIESEEHAIREVCVYFQSGAHLDFLCGHTGCIYPEDRIVEGDYELRRVGERKTAQNAKAKKPAVMEETAIHELCATNPNQAFLYWRSFEEDLLRCPPLGREDERKFRAMRDTFREWFEDLGHWRELRPKAEDLDPDDHNAHAKHQRQIEEFMAARRARVRIIEYDDPRKAHTCQHVGTEHEDVEYNWEFFRDGVSQVIVRTAGGNVLPPHRDPLKRQYFKNTPPSGYAILESGNRLEGTVFFPNGHYYSFDPCFGDENRFLPEEFFRAGDYELRRIGKKGAALEESIAKHTALIPDILQMVEGTPQKTAALLRGTIKQRLGKLGTVIEEDFTASPHFTNLTWRGSQYVLRGSAAVIIETLYIAQKHYSIPGLHQEEVFAQVYGPNKKDWPSNNTRIQNFFRTGDAKRLWDDGCVQHDGKGNFRLSIKIHT